MKPTITLFALAAGTFLTSLVTGEEIIRETARPATVAESIQAGGTIAQFGENTISLKSEEFTGPVQFRYSTSTQWVDQAGNVVTRESVRTGAPVTIFYSKGADGLLVSKIVVRQQPGKVVERVAATSAPATVQETVTTTTTGAQPIPAIGTITQFGDNSIALRTEPSAAPVQYRFSNTTQWVDEAGNVVTRESLQTGMPATVYYTRAADGLIISKVVVRRQPTTVQETVTTTTTGPTEAAGTITQFGDGFVALRTEAAASPVQYLFSDTTKWMDDSGNIIARESVRTGVPVTIYYTKSPQGLITSKVVVRRGAAPPVVERTEVETVEKAAPKTNGRRTVVEERPATKQKTVVKEKPAAKVVEREVAEPVVVAKPAPAVVEKKTTTTTTTEKKKKKDEDEEDDD